MHKDRWTALLCCNVVGSERCCNLYGARLNSWRKLQGQEDGPINSASFLAIVVWRVLNYPYIIVLTRMLSALVLQPGVSNPGKGEGAEKKQRVSSCPMQKKELMLLPIGFCKMPHIMEHPQVADGGMASSYGG
jgi:hypothetical protein